MAVKFTKEQESAINYRGGQIIVSAAAGSGKTAVLTERVVGMIYNGECDITDVIVVTFTEAAASEMKHKILQNIIDKLGAEPKNFRLRRQLALMPHANIQTVHSFCNSLVREHFLKCDIAHDFELLDESEKNKLIDEALENILEELYKNFENDSDFRALFENFANERGDFQIVSLVKEVYNKLRSHPNPIKWLEYTSETAQMAASDSPENHGWGMYLLSQSKQIHKFELQRLKECYDELATVPEVFEKYQKAYEDTIKQGEEIEKALSLGWDTAFKALCSFEKLSFSPCKYQDKTFTLKMRENRERYIDAISDIRGKYISQSAENAVKESSITAPIIRAICKIVISLDKELVRLKKENNCLDFSDLEHMTLKLLSDENHNPTEVARDISDSTYELLVDEFQDTNEIQDRIFEAIRPKTKNVFYVGDVKQSIYKFRLANPEIFIDKYQVSRDIYQDISDQERSVKLDLNKNFRSRKQVIDCVNYLFRKIMTRDFGDIDYDESQALNVGASYSEGGECELCLIDFSQSEDSDEKKIQSEARYTAQKIKQLLQEFSVENPSDGSKRQAVPSDFAILLSSFGEKYKYFEEELSNLNIPCGAAANGDFFGSGEISTVMSLLRVIDNPLQDIPMAAMLTSPVYGFPPDFLVKLRISAPKGYLWNGMEALAEQGDCDCERLIQDILSYSKMKTGFSVEQLIQRIYSDFQIENVFSTQEMGRNRVENLEMFKNLAKNYEKSSAKGLFKFLNFLDSKKQEGQSFASQSTGDGVQIMSIHKSKGLEYPVVILPDLNKGFNRDDVKKNALFHEHIQIGLKYRSFETKLVYKSQIFNAVSAKLTNELSAEEMRKLYVAMTRAKEKLIMIASVASGQKFLEKCSELPLSGFAPQACLRCNSFAGWIFGAFLCHPRGTALRANLEKSPIIDNYGGGISIKIIAPPQELPPIEKGCTTTEMQDEALPQIKPWVKKEYAQKNLTLLPSKLSPTQLKKLKGSEEEKLPQIMGKNREKGAKTGNAVHKCMELLDFNSCINTPKEKLVHEIRLQVDKMLKDGMLGQEEIPLINIKKVAGFFEGPVGDILQKALKNGDKIIKEYQFAALFTPQELFGDQNKDDTIIVNGIMDLIIVGKEHISIIDYKSQYVYKGKEEEAVSQHEEQLNLYSIAAEKIFGLPVKEKIVYLYGSNKAVNIGKRL